ncbi:ABC transporter substrate-binding protein [Paraphotobacterium marinum]
MRYLTFIFVSICLLQSFFVVASENRIISIGPSVTTTLSDLDELNTVIGVDLESQMLPKFHKLKNIGYKRMLNLEGVLSMNPTLIIFDADSGPAQTIQQFKESGIKTITLNRPDTINNILRNINTIGKETGKSQLAEKLVYSNKLDIKKAQKLLPHHEIPGMFLMFRNDTLVTLGSNSLGNNWLKYLNIKNLNKVSNTKVNKESLLKTQAKIILIASEEKKMSDSYKKIFNLLKKNGTKIIFVPVLDIEKSGSSFGQTYYKLSKVIYGIN